MTERDASESPAGEEQQDDERPETSARDEGPETSPDDERPGKLADELERDADRLEQRSEELGEEIDSVRTDWERKRADPNIDGALPRDESGRDPGQGERSEDAPGDQPG